MKTIQSLAALTAFVLCAGVCSALYLALQTAHSLIPSLKK